MDPLPQLFLIRQKVSNSISRSYLTFFVAESESYLADYGFHHKALLSDLSPGQEYFYSCGTFGAKMSDVYSFHTVPKLGNRDPLRFAIFGDMVSSFSCLVLFLVTGLGK